MGAVGGIGYFVRLGVYIGLIIFTTAGLLWVFHVKKEEEKQHRHQWRLPIGVPSSELDINNQETGVDKKQRTLLIIGLVGVLLLGIYTFWGKKFIDLWGSKSTTIHMPPLPASIQNETRRKKRSG